MPCNRNLLQISTRDIGTHISPESSANSSFIRMSSACNEEQEQSTYLEIIDVEVDKKVTIGSLKNVHRDNESSSRSSRHVDDCMKKTTAPLGRSTTYELRITAWENPQKARAEAAVQKLEMKLEKKKASSMEKIMKKLKSSQKMRKSMLAGQLDHAAKPVSSDRKFIVHVQTATKELIEWLLHLPCFQSYLMLGRINFRIQG